MADNTKNEYKTEQNDSAALSQEQPSTSSSSNSTVTEVAKRRKLSRKIHIDANTGKPDSSEITLSAQGINGQSVCKERVASVGQILPNFQFSHQCYSIVNKFNTTAVAGCSHGEMDKIYATMAEIERQEGCKFDLLICCGDYEAIRNYGDLKHMHVPEKYRRLRNFHRYYSGESEAPVLTIFIGGNHEASGYLQELPYGGWVAPKIFYLGHASVVQFAGLRIAGLSGIYNKNDYNMGHWERPPFIDYGAVVSTYHVRSVDVFRLKQLKPRNPNDPPIDIMVTHDWPAGITDYGDVKQLLKLKPYFEEDLKKNALGNPASMTLLHVLKPRYWLAAHMHCFFAALVPHPNKNNPENDFEPTRFLSLDKPLPRRHFLQVLEFDVDQNASLNLSYDPTWLAILKATDALTSVSKNKIYMPSQHTRNERWDFRPTQEELAKMDEIYGRNFTIPMNFKMTARPHTTDEANNSSQELYYRNPQSTEFCAKLGIKDLNEMLCSLSVDGLGVPYYVNKNNNSEDVVLKNRILERKEDFGDETDFIVDRNPAPESLLLKDFKTPVLKSSDESSEHPSSTVNDYEKR